MRKRIKNKIKNLSNKIQNNDYLNINNKFYKL